MGLPCWKEVEEGNEIPDWSSRLEAVYTSTNAKNDHLIANYCHVSVAVGRKYGGITQRRCSLQLSATFGCVAQTGNFSFVTGASDFH